MTNAALCAAFSLAIGTDAKKFEAMSYSLEFAFRHDALLQLTDDTLTNCHDFCTARANQMMSVRIAAFLK